MDTKSRLQSYAGLVEMSGILGHISQAAMQLSGGSHLRANKQSVGELAGAWTLRARLHAPYPSKGLQTPHHPVNPLAAHWSQCSTSTAG